MLLSVHKCAEMFIDDQFYLNVTEERASPLLFATLLCVCVCVSVCVCVCLCVCVPWVKQR